MSKIDTFSASSESVDIRHELSSSMSLLDQHQIIGDLSYFVGREVAFAEVQKYQDEKPLGPLQEFGGKNLAGTDLPDYMNDIMSLIGKKEGENKQNFITQSLQEAMDRQILDKRLSSLKDRSSRHIKSHASSFAPGFSQWHNPADFSDQTRHFILPNYVRKALLLIAVEQGVSVSDIISHGLLKKMEQVLDCLEQLESRTSGILCELGPYHFADFKKEEKMYQRRVLDLIAAF